MFVICKGSRISNFVVCRLQWSTMMSNDDVRKYQSSQLQASTDLKFYISTDTTNFLVVIQDLVFLFLKPKQLTDKARQKEILEISLD